MEHYERSRPTKWLTRNPLLVVKARTFSNGDYENHRFITLNLERACSLLFMLASLQNGFPVHRNESLFETGGINNWQTQDIYHFILLEPKVSSGRIILRALGVAVLLRVVRIERRDFRTKHTTTSWCAILA
jgi:hypothetical protein